MIEKTHKIQELDSKMGLRNWIQMPIQILDSNTSNIFQISKLKCLIHVRMSPKVLKTPTQMNQ